MGALLARVGANTATLVQNALDTWVPDYDLVLIILNEPGFGGCGGGGFQIVTLGSSWSVMAHEFGHGTGGLADEYCQPGTYAGGEPGAVNITANTNRNTLKWRQFVEPATPIPSGINPTPGTGICTGLEPGAAAAGLEQRSGRRPLRRRELSRHRSLSARHQLSHARQFAARIARSATRELKTLHHAFSGHNFLHCYAGDFNGDGKDDLLVHNGNSIMLFRSNGAQLDLVFSAVERVPGSWQFQAGRPILHRRLQRRWQRRGRGLQQHELGHGIPGPAGRRRQQRIEADRAV